jgi:hypothetical protein
MTTLPRILRVLAATMVAALAALPAAGPALANGLGDLYVAMPGRVDEVFLAGEEVVNKVDIKAGPARLAFSPDGSSLFVVNAEGALGRIDIETISFAKTYDVTDAVAIAHPKGDSLYITRKGEAVLKVLQDGEDAATAGPALHGVADILASDRHEYRFVAAQKGHAWLDIVEPASATVRKATLDGDVVGVSIARDEGYAWVALKGPNSVARVNLDTGGVTKLATLPGAPTAITAVPEAAVVAIGARLYRVKDGKAAAWSDTITGIKDDVVSLATSDEGAFVYAATAKAIVAVNVANPRTAPAAEVAMADPVALAPVPKASSLVPKGGDNAGNGTGNGTGNGKGNGTGNGTGPGHSRAPATDTEDSGPLWTRPGQDLAPMLWAGGAIVLAVLFGSRLLMKRSLGEK